MVVRATMQGAHQSPASRGSLAATVRRLLVAGLTATVIATSRPALLAAAGEPIATASFGVRALPPGDADRARGSAGPAPALHDVGGPELSSEPGTRPGATSAPSPARPTDATGKATRPEDIQQQGSVVAVFDDPVDPLIVIAVDHGYLTVRLRCGDRCPTIHRGDYVVAEGLGRSEAVFDADDVWVVGP
jgi:hypothetical protein